LADFCVRVDYPQAVGVTHRNSMVVKKTICATSERLARKLCCATLDASNGFRFLIPSLTTRVGFFCSADNLRGQFAFRDDFAAHISGALHVNNTATNRLEEFHFKD